MVRFLRDCGGEHTHVGDDVGPEQHGTCERIGKYVVVSKIGEGAQSVVYRAVHPELGTEVAIKPGRSLLDHTGTEIEAIRKEGQLLSELIHPNLARVFDFDFQGDRPFLVLEYVRGSNLRQFVQQSSLSPQRSASLMVGIAHALSLVHRQGILHLDVKPTNIAIDRDGTPRLIDFGLSRRFDAWSDGDSDSDAAISGTVQFMSPEQAAGDSAGVDQRSDTFSLGATLYFLLAGKAPYGDGSLGELIRQAQRCDWDREALDAPHVPVPLRRICLKAMSAKPEDRYATMDDFAQDLASFAAPPRASRRSRLAVLAVFFLAVPIVGWAFGWFTPAETPVAGTQIPGSIIDSTFPDVRLALNVRLFDAESSFDLVGPLENGDKLQISATIPPSVHAALFLFTSVGELKELAHAVPSETEQTLHYPESAGQVVPLTGSPGTECFFVCADRERPVSVESVRLLWGPTEQWPAIPDALVLRLGPDGVLVEQRSRDLGAPQDLPNPETVVIRQLELLQKKFSKRFVAFDGIVFVHRE